MYTCDHCRDLLWDDLFGLLEPDESASLHQHLATCPECQVEKVRAEKDQRLVAQAARLDVVVPLFTAPVVEVVPFTQVAEPLPVVRKRRRGVYPWLAVAAGILLLVGLPATLFYQGGLRRREAALENAEGLLAKLVGQREQAKSEATKDAEDASRAARARFLQIQATGFAESPTTGPSIYLVQATSLSGASVDVRLTTRLVDDKGRVLAEAKNVQGRDRFFVQLPPSASVENPQAVRLELDAQGPGEPVRLQKSFPAYRPSYATQLSMDKPVYAPGEHVFLRSVTLERFERKPADQPFTVSYTLGGPKGLTTQSPLKGLTLPGSIGGGEFILPGNCPEGEYTLTATEAENRFPTVTRHFLVRRAGGQGERPTPPTATTAPKTVQVEFFPEGGDLVPGLPQRVYFRVYTAEGQPIEIDGRVVDFTDREVVPVHTSGSRDKNQPAPSPGLGVFTFTPRANTSYRLQIDSPAGITVTPRLPVAPLSQSSAVGLHVPTSVVNAGESIEVAVLEPGQGQRQVLIGVFCGGRLVAEQAVQTKPGSNLVRINPSAGTAGVLRVTLFTSDGPGLRPIAERLVYRQPASRLGLSVTAEKATYRPGERVRLMIHSLNEKNQPETAWLLASVVNESSFRRGGNLPGSSQAPLFYLGSEIKGPADLEGADLLLSDSPQAAAAVDLFLGTQGWRRFVEVDERGSLASKDTADRNRTTTAAASPMFVMNNRAEAHQQLQHEIDTRLAEINKAFDAHLLALEQEQQSRVAGARAAAVSLAEYKARGIESLRLVIGTGAVLCFAVGGTMLLLTLLRLVRKATLHRPYLVGSFSALLLCLLTLLTRSNWATIQSTSPTTALIDQFVTTWNHKRDQQPQIALQNTGPAIPPVAEKADQQRAFASTVRTQEPFVAHNNSARPAVGRGDPADFRNSASPMIAPLSPGGKQPDQPVKPPGVRPFQLRVYASRFIGTRPGMGPTPETLLWHPILVTEDGRAYVEFNLPSGSGTYRIRVEGHSATGCQGVVERKLECRPAETGERK
jgi:hypothetical protein